MILFYSILLFGLTFIGGSLPLWYKGWEARQMRYILAFSGSFLLCITLLHLIPESLFHLGSRSALLIIAGFFLQQLFQKVTHGIEHGHVHTNTTTHDNHAHKFPIMPIFVGLVIHAFSEGLPLAGNIQETGILSSLFLAIALHKLPEAMLITSMLILHGKSIKQSWWLLALFSLITPLTTILAFYLGNHFSYVQQFVDWSIPVVAGAFLHIASTIFFESGTKAHEMNNKKWIAIALGIAISLLSLLGGHQH